MGAMDKKKKQKKRLLSAVRVCERQLALKLCDAESSSSAATEESDRRSTPAAAVLSWQNDVVERKKVVARDFDLTAKETVAAADEVDFEAVVLGESGHKRPLSSESRDSGISMST